jgi:hypothetical protein
MNELEGVLLKGVVGHVTTRLDQYGYVVPRCYEASSVVRRPSKRVVLNLPSDSTAR